MYKSYYPKAAEIDRKWVLVDAAGQTLGRLASKVAAILIGKNKPTFTPGVELGDFVIVVNASQIVVTGKKLDEKKYYRHSHFPGGLKETRLRDMLAKHPDRVIRAAVRGMLPHNKAGTHMLKRLRVYGGAEHPHATQNPQKAD